jgi:hypothetical protein
LVLAVAVAAMLAGSPMTSQAVCTVAGLAADSRLAPILELLASSSLPIWPFDGQAPGNLPMSMSSQFVKSNGPFQSPLAEFMGDLEL